MKNVFRNTGISPINWKTPKEIQAAQEEQEKQWKAFQDSKDVIQQQSILSNNAYLPATGDVSVNPQSNATSVTASQTTAPVNFEKVLKNLILDREPKAMKDLQKFADIDYYGIL